MAQKKAESMEIEYKHRGEIVGLFIVTLSLVILISKVIHPSGDAFGVFIEMLAIAETFVGAGI